jgi:antitoxin StbD
MTRAIHAGVTASVTDLKRDPMGTVAAGAGRTVAILNRNRPAFYCVPVAEYEAMLDRLEDMDLNAIADARADCPELAMSLDAL